MNKKILIVLIIVLLLGGYGLYKWNANNTSTPPNGEDNVTDENPSINDQDRVVLGTPFTLGVGESKWADDIQITFKELRQDSRCPVDVQCIQAGSVTVLLEVGEQDVPLELPGSSTIANAAAFRSYTVTLVSVEPQEKRSTVDIPKNSYKATLRVDSHGDKG